MRNWMMLALDAKLRNEAGEDGSDDGFGAAFDEGVGEVPPANGGGSHAGGEEGTSGADNGGDDGGSGEDDGGGEAAAGSDQGGTGEAAGEGDAGAAEGEESTEGGTGEGQGESQESAPSPTGQRVGGDEAVPADQHAGQQQLDPATLAYMFQHFAGNRQNQQGGHSQGQEQGQSQGQQGGQQETPQQQAPKDWTEYLTDEEKQVLDKYNEEWSEVSEAEQIRVNAVARQTREQVLGEVNQALAPIVEHVRQSQVQEHFTKIRQAHEDFDDLKQGPLQEWVNKQTNPMVRNAAQQVLQQGSADDVIGLIDLYKRDVGSQETGKTTGAAPDVPASSQVPAKNGGAPQVTTQQQQQKAPPKAPPKPAANHKAASATAAVNTGSRGADPRGNDPTDFEAGFAEEVTAGN